jgi:NTP pyrophosphatase (non-canonical NTP hydrolase)
MPDDPPQRLQIEAVVDSLRSGCPFNGAQGPADLLDALQSELDELRAAIASGAVDAIREELGDVLFNVVALAAAYRDAGDFDLEDVDRLEAGKMVRRHPYVFADEPAPDAETARVDWKRHKADEAQRRREAQAGLSILAHVTPPRALSRADLELVAERLVSDLSYETLAGPEPLEIVAKRASGSSIVACELVARDLVHIMAFTAAPLEPSRMRAMIDEAFGGSASRVSVETVQHER